MSSYFASNNNVGLPFDYAPCVVYPVSSIYTPSDTAVAAVIGDGLATLALTGAAAGDHGVVGTGAATLAATGAASGLHGVAGSAVATVSANGAVAGNHGVAGAGVGQIVLTDAATAQHGVASQGAGSVALIGAAQGEYYGTEEPAQPVTLTFISRRADAFEPAAVVGSCAAVIAFRARARGTVGGSGSARGVVSFAGRGYAMAPRVERDLSDDEILLLADAA